MLCLIISQQNGYLPVKTSFIQNVDIFDKDTEEWYDNLKQEPHMYDTMSKNSFLSWCIIALTSDDADLEVEIFTTGI